MLVNLQAVLEPAVKGRYAVGGFNITGLETALAIAEAAEREKSPVIFQISAKTIDYMGLDLAAAIGLTLANRLKVPAVVHLDHGTDLELAEQALKGGFSSIMLDVSRVPVKERIPIVRDFVQRAKKKNVSVEAEEDAIGGREDYVIGDRSHFTEPKRASEFVRLTGCAAYAVSIGSTHGQPLPNEKLDLELLSEIARSVPVPLVLHGASSTPITIIREAISRGISKINIDTDLRLAFTGQLRRTLRNDDLIDPRDELKPAREEVCRVVREKMRLFGSSGQA
ncbi:MAG: class II fructose-bisphosphate aldolase [Patescibacteria group bacterium]